MNEKTITLDVREDLKKGRDPFAKIMQTVSALKRNQKFRLITPFRPAPLFGIMTARGFSHCAKTIAHGDWEVLFTREKEEEVRPRTSSPLIPSSEDCPCGCGRKVFEVDARNVEPPQALAKILEALPQISDSTEVKALTNWRPIQLYQHLDERGYVGRTKEKNGEYVTYIHRAATPGRTE